MRWVAARLADALLIGAAIAVASLLLNLLMRSPVPPIWIVAVLLAAAGLGALLRLPTHLQTACRLDRSAGLHDLLSTAWLANGDEPWSQLVREQGRHALAAIPPTRLATFGPRAHLSGWLILAAVLGSSLLGHSVQRSATASAGTNSSGQALEQRPGSLQALAAVGGMRSREGESEMRGSSEDNPLSQPQPGSRSPRDTSGSADARGDGRADSSVARPPMPPSPGEAPSRQTAPGRLPGGGDGVAAPSRPGGGANNDGRILRARQAEQPAPWQTDDWPVQREAARAAIQEGRIPVAYRAMVRDYFDR